MWLGSNRPDASGWQRVTHPPGSSPRGHFHIPVGLGARAHLLFPSSMPLPEEMPARSLGQTGQTQQEQALSTGATPPSLDLASSTDAHSPCPRRQHGTHIYPAGSQVQALLGHLCELDCRPPALGAE